MSTRIAAIYARVSTREQREEGSSLASQIDACLGRAEAGGYRVPEHLRMEEDWTGTTLDRPRLNELRESVRRREINALFCYSTDRLARDPIHLAIIAEECEKYEVALRFVTEPLDNSPEGQLIRYVKGYAAQIEREKIIDRTLRGRRSRAARGRIPGSGAHLYGYTYLPGAGEGQGIRVVKEEEARVVKLIFSWYVEEGLSIRSIALKLTELGIPSPTGSRWGMSTVHRILVNPAYTGKTFAFRFAAVEPSSRRKVNARPGKSSRTTRPKEEWLEVPGATPSIIDGSIFALVQERMDRNKQLASRHRRWQYLLSGYIRCGICGHSYVGKTTKQGNYIHHYYYCSGKDRAKNPKLCPGSYVNGSEADRLVWNEVAALLKKPELVTGELARRQADSGAREQWQTELEQVERRLGALAREQQRLVRLYRYGEIDDSYIERELQRLTKERESLILERKGLEERLGEKPITPDDLQAVKEYCKQVAQNLESLSFEEKRLALEVLQVKVTVEEDRLVLDGALPLSVASTHSGEGARG